MTQLIDHRGATIILDDIDSFVKASYVSLNAAAISSGSLTLLIRRNHLQTKKKSAEIKSHCVLSRFSCYNFEKYLTASFSRTLFLLVFPSRSIPQSGHTATCKEIILALFYRMNVLQNSNDQMVIGDYVL